MSEKILDIWKLTAKKYKVPYMDSALNMDTPNIFKSKFYRHMALRTRKEKQLKR